MPAPNAATKRLFAGLTLGLPEAQKRVREALESTGGDVRAAAQRLGVGRATLHRWLDEGLAAGPQQGRGAYARKKAANSGD